MTAEEGVPGRNEGGGPKRGNTEKVQEKGDNRKGQSGKGLGGKEGLQNKRKQHH